MELLRSLLTPLVLLGLTATPALAQQVTLTIQDGRVSLDANNAPVSVILSEWARVGGSRVVNGERLPGGLVSLRLSDVPEREALDIVLRDVSGYLLAPRQAGAGASRFDRILILATSSAPRAAATPAPAGRGVPARPGFLPPPVPSEAPVQPGFDDQMDDDDLTIIGDDSDIEPQEPQDQPFMATPGRGPARRPGQALPLEAPVEGGGTVVIGGESPADADLTESGSNPFGVPAGSSGRPGEVNMAPDTSEGPLTSEEVLRREELQRRTQQPD